MKDKIRDILDLPGDLFFWLLNKFEEVPTLFIWLIAIGITLYLILKPNGAN
jgi:hypothetical protein